MFDSSVARKNTRSDSKEYFPYEKVAEKINRIGISIIDAGKSDQFNTFICDRDLHFNICKVSNIVLSTLIELGYMITKTTNPITIDYVTTINYGVLISWSQADIGKKSEYNIVI